jgi:CRISPR/Cas system-associated exonuclease Cas4 (RecB family)
MPDIKHFKFSSGNLQDFLDCERRFELKYLLSQEWPSPQSEPVLEVESRIRTGREFHFMIHQYLCGIPLPDLQKMELAPDIHYWLERFEIFFKGFPFVEFHSEYTVVTPFQGDYYLTAVYDLIGMTDQPKLLIMDWKTSPHRPKKEIIAQAVQSFLYPYLAFENRTQIFKGAKIDHGEIEMIYWNAVHPNESVSLSYSLPQYEKNSENLKKIIETIIGKPMGAFAKTENTRKCAYCQYRSLCQRGSKAGSFDQDNGDHIDLDSLISEIQFDDSAEIPF